SDLAIATRSARFNLAYTRSGLTPDGGATWFLPRLVGTQRAFDIMALNPTLSAEQAEELGLIARVVDDESFASEVEWTLQQLA
ncbi:MAG: enoyl-CoA hydratase/isomerase family protein, partial [Gammaproteobacteria bacterium]